MSRIPGVIESSERNGFLRLTVLNFGEIVQGFFFCPKSRLGAGDPAELTVFSRPIAYCPDRDPGLIRPLIDAALPVAPGFWLFGYILLCSALQTEPGILRQFSFTFSAFHSISRAGWWEVRGKCPTWTHP